MSFKVEMQITSKQGKKKKFTPEQSVVRPVALQQSRIKLDGSFRGVINIKMQNPLSNVQESGLVSKKKE